jgi:hypothetical protein
MDFEFHYYITGIIAHEAGFSKEESETIAYASQLVDENSVIFDVQDKETGDIYSNYVSQTINILRPRKTLMRIYPTFHFVPGDPTAKSARRKDGKMHILNTTPNSELAQDLMYKAFNSSEHNRLQRIGITTHVYVDTWAHQNFVGFNDSFNGFSMNPIPNIGHADVFLNPDRINLRWVDDRLVKSDVNNNLRFISAAENLFHLYTNYLKLNKSWDVFGKKLLKIMNRPEQKERLKLYFKLAPWLPVYDKFLWFNNSIEQEVSGLKDTTNEILAKFIILKDKYWWKEGVEKENTNWFKFQEAVKEHQAEVLIPINDICKCMGVDIRLF